MKNTIKQIIAPILILLAILSIYFSGIAPFMRARAYIGALNSMSNIRTVEDFKDIYNPVVNSNSLIGDEEIVQYLSSEILGIMLQENQPDDAIRELFNYVEPYLYENDVRHLLMGAYACQILWEHYGQKEKDFLKAEEYYLKAIDIGPNIPPVLYGLFGLYYDAYGYEEKTKQVGNQILSNWPDDEEIKKKLESI